MFSNGTADRILGAHPPTDTVPRTLSLYQQAWVLRIAAIELHAGDAAIASHVRSMRSVLKQLFVSPAAEDGMGVQVARARVLSLVGGCGQPVVMPSLGAVGAARVRSVLSGLGLEGMLTTGAPGQGVWVENERGDAVVDIKALKDALLLKYDRGSVSDWGVWVSQCHVVHTFFLVSPCFHVQNTLHYSLHNHLFHSHPLHNRYKEHALQYGTTTPPDGQSDDVAQACRAAFEYAQQYNAAVQQLRAHAEVSVALHAVVQVACTQRYTILADVLADVAHDDAGVGGVQPLDVLYQLLGTVLDALLLLLRAGGEGSVGMTALPLCRVVGGLVTKLQQECAAATRCSGADGQLLDAYGSGMCLGGFVCL